MKLLNDKGGQDTDKAIIDLENRKLPSDFSYRQAYFVGCDAQHQLDLKEFIEEMHKIADNGIPAPHKRAKELLESLKQLGEVSDEGS